MLFNFQFYSTLDRIPIKTRKMEIMRSASILILCAVVVIDCATVVNILPTDHAESVELIENKSEENIGKRASRQVAVNVGPVGVGVGPFGGVGVRVGPWLNIGVAPSKFLTRFRFVFKYFGWTSSISGYRRAVPVLYPAPVPVAYPAPAPVPVVYTAPAVPVTYQATDPVQRGYSYSSNYRYNYSYWCIQRLYTADKW